MKLLRYSVTSLFILLSLGSYTSLFAQEEVLTAYASYGVIQGLYFYQNDANVTHIVTPTEVFLSGGSSNGAIFSLTSDIDDGAAINNRYWKISVYINNELIFSNSYTPSSPLNTTIQVQAGAEIRIMVSKINATSGADGSCTVHLTLD